MTEFGYLFVHGFRQRREHRVASGGKAKSREFTLNNNLPPSSQLCLFGRLGLEMINLPPEVWHARFARINAPYFSDATRECDSVDESTYLPAFGGVSKCGEHVRHFTWQ